LTTSSSNGCDDEKKAREREEVAIQFFEAGEDAAVTLEA